MTAPNLTSSCRPRRMNWLTTMILVVASVVGFSAFAQFKKAVKGEVWTCQVVAKYPHDATAFTQGLVVSKGRMFEGTGRNGDSSLRLVDLESGKIEKIAPLHSHYFGEGITLMGDQIYQLTWQNRLGIVYDAQTFDVQRTFQYSGEGWGLTNDGQNLIMSDGSATLRFLDPKKFEVVKRITVHSASGKVDRLNELEYVKDEIWANIWYEDTIVRISPKDGEVLGWIDLSSLYPRHQRGSKEEVLNGIAYDHEKDRLFVTGKNWPMVYEIKVNQK